jgi:hypothetical protein
MFLKKYKDTVKKMKLAFGDNYTIHYNDFVRGLLVPIKRGKKIKFKNIAKKKFIDRPYKRVVKIHDNNFINFKDDIKGFIQYIFSTYEFPYCIEVLTSLFFSNTRIVFGEHNCHECSLGFYLFLLSYFNIVEPFWDIDFIFQ